MIWEILYVVIDSPNFFFGNFPFPGLLFAFLYLFILVSFSCLI